MKNAIRAIEKLIADKSQTGVFIDQSYLQRVLETLTQAEATRLNEQQAMKPTWHWVTGRYPHFKVTTRRPSKRNKDGFVREPHPDLRAAKIWIAGQYSFHV